MTQRDKLLEGLEGLLRTMEDALKERERGLRACLCANRVSNIDEIEDLQQYKVALDVSEQVDALKDFIEDLKLQINIFGAFKYL